MLFVVPVTGSRYASLKGKPASSCRLFVASGMQAFVDRTFEDGISSVDGKIVHHKYCILAATLTGQRSATVLVTVSTLTLLICHCFRLPFANIVANSDQSTNSPS
ncbi:putative malate dehydrogenase [Trichinella spiralis]|uniref:putative malate dehydrogenase n=1 Tax=Trichinella spiralis TaxID=6334 RepID=UPI0001EFB2B8|nr:putative malate dehydrogenase [Trichinella spiralis]